MKKLMLPLLTVSVINGYSQTAPTTTITGSLRVNDSLSVSKNLEAADITSRGEMIAKDVMRAEKDIYVDGSASIEGNLTVKGYANLSGGTLTPDLYLGNANDYLTVNTQTLQGGGRVLAFGFAGPFPKLPTTCIKPYNASTLSIFNSRTGVINPSSPNMLDFSNDGLNGFIDYGYDSGLYPMPDTGTAPVVIPSLKINGVCYGNVEIARGGGYVSTGNYLEVGSPDRTSQVAFNVKATNRIGQRITVISPFSESNPAPPDVYNSQFFVNRNRTKALTVFNTSANPNGDQTFVVYGNGKTHIGKGRPLVNGPVANAMLTVDGLVIAKEVKVTVSSAYWADYVFDKSYKLLPLNEVRSFIDKHGHLPNVPSTDEITTTGNDLGKTDAILLAKIEECMLYIMQLDKKVDELQKENAKLKSKNKK